MRYILQLIKTINSVLNLLNSLFQKNWSYITDPQVLQILIGFVNY